MTESTKCPRTGSQFLIRILGSRQLFCPEEEKEKNNSLLVIVATESDGYRNCNSKITQTRGALLRTQELQNPWGEQGPALGGCGLF